MKSLGVTYKHRCSIVEHSDKMLRLKEIKHSEKINPLTCSSSDGDVERSRGAVTQVWAMLVHTVWFYTAKICILPAVTNASC